MVAAARVAVAGPTEAILLERDWELVFRTQIFEREIGIFLTTMLSSEVFLECPGSIELLRA